MQYRGIALLCSTYKIYCHIFNARMCNWLPDNNVLVDEQNGFRRLRSCIDHMFSLYSILQNRLLSKNETFCCFVDLKKAFDSVDRDCLWFKLLSLGVHGNFYNALKSLYSDVSCAVRVNGSTTDWFSVGSGVKQGCLLSPSLFSIYINDFAHELNELN